jgi:hypothetical protein
MVCKRAALFRGRHFRDEIIVLCVLFPQLSRFDGDDVRAEPLDRSIYDLEMGAALRAGIE